MSIKIGSFSEVISNTSISSGLVHIINTDNNTEIVHSYTIDGPVDRVSLLSAYEAGQTILHHIETEGG